MSLAPAEIVLEDQRSVAAFLTARLAQARAQPSVNAMHDLVLALQVGHRRAQRALSLVFDGTEDVRLKRDILERYAVLDRMLEELEQDHTGTQPGDFVDRAADLAAAIDRGFCTAHEHIDQVRDAQPEVHHLEVTRPAQPRDPEGSTTEVWFSDNGFDEDAPTRRFLATGPTRRGH